MVMPFAVVFFLLGLIIGSFLNVVILRMNSGRSMGGRSACMSCLNKLSWYELIPLFSFVGLKGRCRSCKVKISIQYPVVELLTGAVFLLLFIKFQEVFSSPFLFTVSFSYYAVVFSVLMVIAAYDIKHKIIPDVLAIIFGLLSFVSMFLFVSNVSTGVFSLVPHIPSIMEFLSGIFLAFPFAFFWYISGGKWMGLGDAKLALGIGWLLRIAFGLSGLVIAFWSGALVGVVLIIASRRRKKGRVGMKSEVPFAPFMVFGTFIAFIFGLNLFGI